MASKVGGREFDTYHGSPRADLEILRAELPIEQRPRANPLSTFGVFSTPNQQLANSYANGGRVYTPDFTLNEPYHVNRDDFYNRFVGDNSPQAFQEAAELKARLQRDGFDGVVLWDGEPRVNPDGTLRPDADPINNIQEVVSFADVPARGPKDWDYASGAAPLARRAAALTDPTDPKLGVGDDPNDFIWRILPDTHKALLRNEIDFEGNPTRLYHVNQKVQEDVEHLRVLGQAHARTPLTGTDLQDFTRLAKKYESYEPRYDWSDPHFTDAEVDRIAAEHTTALWSEQKFGPKKTTDTGALAGIKHANKDIMAFRRSVGLYNWAAAPRQTLTQWAGNAVAAGLTGKPSLIFDALKPGESWRMYRKLRGTVAQTDWDASLERQGLAPNKQIDNASKSIAKHQTGITSPLLASIRSKVAPDFLGDLAATPDHIYRNAAARRSFNPAMKRVQKDLPKTAVDTANAWRRKGLYLDPASVDAAVKTALTNAKRRGSPISEIDGGQLEKAVYDAFSGQKGIDLTELRNFANRVGRDYNNKKNDAYQLAAREAQRVFFSWDTTNIDEAIQNVFLYHYWTTRASALYAREFAKKPWMAGAMFRFAEALNEEAEENDYPEWLKGFTRFVNSPGGVTLFFSPLDLASTFLLFNWELTGNNPLQTKGDLTWFGQLKNLAPLPINPALDILAYEMGLYGGEDAPVPYNPTGMDQMVARVAQLINLAGVHGKLPSGMLTDEFGNFQPLGERVLQEKLVAASAALAGRPQIDVYASAKANTQYFLEDVLREEHPEWATDPNGENLLSRRANEIMLAVDAGQEAPAEYLEAQSRLVDMSLTGPDYPGMPEPLKNALGLVQRVVSPIRITAQPTTKMQRLYGVGQVGDAPGSLPALGTTDDYDLKDAKNRPYDTLDMALLRATNEDYWDIGKDTGIADAARMFNQIGKGTTTANVTIGGYTYTPSQLALMPESERYDIAEKYLTAQGFTPDDKDAYYTARDELMAAHPDLAGYHEYTSYLESYPGGAQGFVDAAVRTSPAFARYMQQTGTTPGTPDYYQAATYPDAFFALEGRRSEVYDPLNLPEAGTIPGLAHGETFAMRRALQDAVDAAAQKSAPANDYEVFVADVDDKVANLYHAQRLLDETFPGSGLRAGVDFIPNTYGMYDTMKAVWDEHNVWVPEKGDIAYEYYYEWLPANATAADHSVEAFLDQRERTGPGKSADMPAPDAADILAQQGMAAVEASPARLDASGMPDTSGMPRATPAYAVEMRTGPSTNNPINVDAVYPEMALYVADRSPDGQWALVVAPGGLTGWVPTAALLKAA
jgi:hypothetical protein